MVDGAIVAVPVDQLESASWRLAADAEAHFVGVCIGLRAVSHRRPKLRAFRACCQRESALGEQLVNNFTLRVGNAPAYNVFLCQPD